MRQNQCCMTSNISDRKLDNNIENSNDKKRNNDLLKEKNKNGHKNNEHNNQNNQDNNQKVVIIGDSLLGGVKENGIRKIAKNNTIKVKCHSGATTEDLIDYINPVIRKKPDVIILHGGTNDITNDIDTGKNIDKIISTIKKKSSETQIVISSVVTRKDQKNITNKVKELNEKLETISCQHNIGFIKHENIQERNLSPKKLHLNKGGSTLLTKNSVNFLNSQ